MRSRLFPSERSGEAQPWLFRNAQPRTTSVIAVAEKPHVRNGVPEADLHRRIAELEQVLILQVAAARQAGFREGEIAGLAQCEAANRALVDRLGHTIQELAAFKPKLRKEMEEDAVLLSLAIAKRILRREMNMDPTALQGLVQVAFERTARNAITRVIVHPDQEQAVREALSTLTTRDIEIFADRSRETGTLLFETQRGAIDVSVESQLQEIEHGLADRLKWR